MSSLCLFIIVLAMSLIDIKARLQGRILEGFQGYIETPIKKYGLLESRYNILFFIGTSGKILNGVADNSKSLGVLVYSGIRVGAIQIAGRPPPPPLSLLNHRPVRGLSQAPGSKDHYDNWHLCMTLFLTL